MLSFVHVLLVSSVLQIPFVCSPLVSDTLQGATGEQLEKDVPVISASKPGFTTQLDLLKLIDMSDECATKFKRTVASRSNGLAPFTLSEEDYNCVQIPSPKFESFDMNYFRVSTCFSLVAIMHYCAGVQLITQSVMNAYVSGDEEQARGSLFEMFESMKDEDRKYFFAVIHFMGSFYDLCEKHFGTRLTKFMSFFDGVAGEDDSAMFPNIGNDRMVSLLGEHTLTPRILETFIFGDFQTLKWVVANHDMAIAVLDSKPFKSKLHDEYSQWSASSDD
ncbi:hypothetical protein RF11_05006 [Thelohanellus kitauei]|uniref:Uncharacterized protein n=1 Tax=Thelohanellus kitauei TaxID=669202 RepID=A0A0C2MLU3_THEKT|nr:hypothetical protein RF11_05006 [Thelohanellus kitauei]